jgi:hypothetical protein
MEPINPMIALIPNGKVEDRERQNRQARREPADNQRDTGEPEGAEGHDYDRDRTA